MKILPVHVFLGDELASRFGLEDEVLRRSIHRENAFFRRDCPDGVVGGACSADNGELCIGETIRGIDTTGITRVGRSIDASEDDDDSDAEFIGDGSIGTIRAARIAGI